MYRRGEFYGYARKNGNEEHCEKLCFRLAGARERAIAIQRLGAGAGDFRATRFADGRIENIRVLLAEDNELNSEIASVLLRENGIEAECAANGKQAYDMFFAHKEHYYDLILMDVMMP
ncbi:MAG TPA: hypothetical protein DCE65_09120, partial [Clostridiales bacterium]|nr:hypothetical protein [Clostridiales bacterium]